MAEGYCIYDCKRTSPTAATMRLAVCVTKLSTYGLGSLLHPPREGSAFLVLQIGHHCWPIRECFRPEENKLSAKEICSIVGVIINQEISHIQIFVMRENQPFIGGSSETRQKGFPKERWREYTCRIFRRER